MEVNQTAWLLKKTLARLKQSQVIVGSGFSLIALFALFVIGSVGNVLLFIQIKNYALISNKLHLLNLIISNLLILGIVVPANFFSIIQAKTNDDNSQPHPAAQSSFSIYNQLVRAEDCESESTLTLIAFFCHLFNFLIFFTLHRRMVHKTKFFYLNWFKLRTEFAFGHDQTAKSNEPLNRAEFSNQNRASNESNGLSSACEPSTNINQLSNGLKGLPRERTNETNGLSNGRPKDLNDIRNLLDELQSNQLSLSASLNYLASSQQVACQQVVNGRRTKSDLAAPTFTNNGQTIADCILIRIRNFVLCFLSAWTVALSLAVLNDLSHEQFSACSVRYRLCAFWFKDLISNENYDQTVHADRAAQSIGGDRPFSPVNGRNSTHNLLDKFSKFGNQTSALGNGAASPAETAATMRTANESERFQNQTTAQLAANDAIGHHYLSNLLSKIERYQSAPSVHYTILVIELIVIFAATLFTIANLANTFLHNRTYRIVPQCYVIERSVLRREEFVCENKHELANPDDQRAADKATDQHGQTDANNKMQSLNGNTNAEIESKTRMNELTSSDDGVADDRSNSVARGAIDALIAKKTRLGKLKNERSKFDLPIRMNAEQIINLSDDSRRTEEGSKREESNCSSLSDPATGRPEEGARDALSFARFDLNPKQRTSSRENEPQEERCMANEARFCLPNQAAAANNPPVANDFMNTNSNTNTVCYHRNHCNCSQQFAESANYYLNRQQQRFNHFDCGTERVVSASSIWTQHTASHTEQKRIAAVFVLIYAFFLLSWLPFGLTVITARLFTWSVNEAATNRTVFAGFGRTAARNSTELDRSETISDSRLELIDDNLNRTNHSVDNKARLDTESESEPSSRSVLSKPRVADRTHPKTSETMLHKIKELNFRLINRLWFITLVYSAFSAYFFPIINRQSLANLIQQTAKQKLNKFVHFISNH